MVESEAISSTVEEYLEAIYRLEEKGGAARTTDLAEHLKVTLGTITNMVESLEKQKFVVHEPYRGVRLTDRGRRMALDVIRRHRLSERLLTDVLRLEWSKVHDAACKLEHVFAGKELSQHLDKALGNPKTCPHGNPIPSELGELREENSGVLTGLDRGEKGTIVKVTDERADMLQYLATLGLVPGSMVEIEEKAPFNGPMIIKIMGASYAIGRDVASVIWVKRS